jgi:outer membrane protein assembly factor BamA
VASEVPSLKSKPIPASSRPYRFWRDLLPQWWSPALRTGGDEIQAGALTSGQDALGIHSFSLEGYYGFSSRRANISFNYTYDGLFPTLSLAYSDSVDYYSGSRSMQRSQELKLASLWPLRLRKRSQLYAYADLHLERRSYSDEYNSFTDTGSFNGSRLGLSFNSAREYYDSVSPADGIRCTLQGFLHPNGLGNEWGSRGTQLDMRQYIPFLRPGVLAWRLALARSWNAGDHFYTMGGREGESGSGLGGDNPFDLLRGFPAGFQFGDRGWQFNLEYRIPLFKIEKAVMPAVSLDRVYLNAFIDLGRLWDKYYTEQTAYSVGGEMVLRLAFGAAAAFDLSCGAAYGIAPEHYWRIYLRTGRSF